MFCGSKTRDEFPEKVCGRFRQNLKKSLDFPVIRVPNDFLSQIFDLSGCDDVGIVKGGIEIVGIYKPFKIHRMFSKHALFGGLQ